LKRHGIEGAAVAPLCSASWPGTNRPHPRLSETVLAQAFADALARLHPLVMALRIVALLFQQGSILLVRGTDGSAVCAERLRW